MTMTKEQREDKLAALIRERDGYLKYGELDRAAEVDEELRKIGQKGEPPMKRATKRAEPKVDAE